MAFFHIIVLLAISLLCSCTSDGNSIFSVSPKSDLEYVCCEGICYDACVDFANASPEDLSDRGYVLRYIADNKKNLSYVSDEFKDDEEIVTKAVTHDGSSLQYASDRLKDKEAVVIKAVEDYGIALSYASENMKNNKNVVLVAVKNKELVLVYASSALKDDQEVAIAAVTKFGGSLKIVSERLRSDLLVIEPAIKNDAASFYRLNDDQTALVRIDDNDVHDVNTGALIEILSDELKHNENVILWAIESFYPEAFAYYQGNDIKTFTKKAVEVANYPRLAEFLPADLLNNKEDAMVLLEVQGQGILKRIAKNPDVDHPCQQAYETKNNTWINGCMAQLNVDPISENMWNLGTSLSLYPALSNELKADRDIINASITANGMSISHLDIDQTNELTNLAIAQNGFAYTVLAEEFKGKKEVLLKALEKNLWADSELCRGDLLQLCTQVYSTLVHANDDLVDEEIVKKAMQYSVFEACNAPISLKQNSAFKEYALSKASVTQKPAISECLAQ